MEYAGFWVRLGATLIDTVIVMIVLTVPLSLPPYGSGCGSWGRPEKWP